MKTNKLLSIIKVILALPIILMLCSCSSNDVSVKDVSSAKFKSSSDSVEAGQILELSCKVDLPKGIIPEFKWSASKGEILETQINGEADFVALEEVGNVIVNVTVTDGENTITRSKIISILEVGAMETTADVLIEVDTNTLRGVWVDKEHPEENFVPPLRIKGTFTYDTETLRATSGGNWPNYDMYDDGTHGDTAAGDGIYSILMIFEKSDSKVYFAFDDGNPYRVQSESAIAERLKLAWIVLDEFPDDNSNPVFTPDKDKVVKWDEEMAEKGKIYEPY
ncbi:MAG: hypothetical protein KJ887_05075 [Candidatus Omnitrophica bacterium]|nr:hypothetical protein [Candidatus Omnitrophota bacterium]MBU1047781.1 hypothetical protein [Candidatus Omnitrophota bacterium]MBU1631051.1 hypothetical protein [Candidatus Omnitrophota bacterium]MBU1766844.1 hypothetical protein [Candidatus Omnitrophota bacterium]MBU1889318.1 hypothetical protein [Candidatus Omnitrophota bacterium]